MEHSTKPRLSRIDTILDLIDDVLDDPYWSVFDGEPSGPEFDREVDIERRLAGRD